MIYFSLYEYLTTHHNQYFSVQIEVWNKWQRKLKNYCERLSCLDHCILTLRSCLDVPEHTYSEMNTELHYDTYIVCLGLVAWIIIQWRIWSSLTQLQLSAYETRALVLVRVPPAMETRPYWKDCTKMSRILVTRGNSWQVVITSLKKSLNPKKMWNSGRLIATTCLLNCILMTWEDVILPRAETHCIWFSTRFKHACYAVVNHAPNIWQRDRLEWREITLVFLNRKPTRWCLFTTHGTQPGDTIVSHKPNTWLHDCSEWRYVLHFSMCINYNLFCSRDVAENTCGALVWIYVHVSARK